MVPANGSGLCKVPETSKSKGRVKIENKNLNLYNTQQKPIH